MDRLAVPVPGDDPAAPFRSPAPGRGHVIIARREGRVLHVPAEPLAERPRFEPRNMTFSHRHRGRRPDPGSGHTDGRLAVPAGTTQVRAEAAGVGPVRAGRGPGQRVPRSPGRPRYSPRNVTFADGLAGWLFGGSFTENVSDSHWRDYTCVVEGGIAVIRSAVPEPAGFAISVREVYADDYRGSEVVFRCEFRVPEGRAGLFLRVNEGRPIRGPLTEQAAFADPDNNVTPVAKDPAWAHHQVSARVPADVDAVVFGIFLAGPGRIELRNPELRPA